VQTTLLRKKLLAWYRREKRTLPWRGSTDPYRIWVSEVMLQQTTVAAVRNRYDGFLRRFPDLASLARSRQDSVLAAWSGLGYYGRARNLRKAARRIVRQHGGRLPNDPETLETLPGFGPYTAAAVASLAFGRRVPAADANVTRVVSRLYALSGGSGPRADREAVLARVLPFLPRRRPGDAIAAFMDLGQSICLPRGPLCGRCPLAPACAARRNGRPQRYPRRARKARPVAVHLAAIFAQRGGRALLVRRRASFLNGLWEFPCAEAATAESARRQLASLIRPLGLRLSTDTPSAFAKHTVVNRRLQIAVFPALSDPQVPIRNPKSFPHRWFRAFDLERAAVPTLTRKIARAAGFLRSPRA
jgi:A/G-specific adenine glycosylase